ncbi:hypothetical protein BX600DRAFT_502965 [Xylariales sp. PMI_506]|nr:hypothetical protein BX600DRAFT_502965 [Xylariales sp. PMI_506]
MAAAAVLPLPTPLYKAPDWTPVIVEPAVTNLTKDDFDPKRHLAFKEMPKVHTMKELGLPEDTGVSPVAVSDPFPLFNKEAVMRMRDEVLSSEVLNNCRYTSNLAKCQLRGYADKYAPFTYDAWKHPETLAVVSKVAGIELVPMMDFEIAHINVSVQTEEEKERQIAAFNERAKAEEEDEPIFGWHRDSYPFVCVTMLSDCTNMVGGETALRIGNGEIMKARGPQMGCAVVMQGRYIEHQALRTIGGTERISMITSFRPRNPLVRDDTVLTTVRGVSALGELYHQFTEYRLEMLEERIRHQLRELREAKTRRRQIPTAKLKAFFEEQEKFLAHMNREMVHDEEVVFGTVETMAGAAAAAAATAADNDVPEKEKEVVVVTEQVEVPREEVVTVKLPEPKEEVPTVEAVEEVTKDEVMAM